MSILNFKILTTFMSCLRFRIDAASVIAPGSDAFSELLRLKNTKQVFLLEVSLIHTNSGQPPVRCFCFLVSGVLFSS